jgi:hypothetical protein
MEALLGQEVIAVLISLLYSIWDGTRSSCFRLLSRLILVGRENKIGLSPAYTSQSNRLGIEARGVYLASSPRQREADTGARILVFLFMSLSRQAEKKAYIQKLTDLLGRRLATMKGMLGKLMSGENDPENGAGTRLPLSHGLTHALRLMVEHIQASSPYSSSSSSSSSSTSLENDEAYGKMASVFCQAIQVSLTVVADVKEGSVVDGMDEELALSQETRGNATPLNVNTGAIGANGTFSSVKEEAEKDQHKKRLAIQRIVVSCKFADVLRRPCCALLLINL